MRPLISNMKRILIIIGATCALFSSCKMQNPFLTESPLPYGAPQFDKIKLEHYMPAFEAGIAEGKANIDKIVADTSAPCFANVIVPMEFCSPILDRVSGVFYNLLEADSNDSMHALAEELNPLMTEYSMYISLNQGLFKKIKAVYDNRDKENLKPHELRLLEQTYRSFVRGGALLDEEGKKKLAELAEEGGKLGLQFSKNALDATNAWSLNVTEESRLEGIPQYVLSAAAETAAEKGQSGWTFTLQYPSYSPFMTYCRDRELRKQMYMASGTKATSGELDNSEIVKSIVKNRIETANLLGYPTYADYVLEERMAKNRETVDNFLNDLLEPTLPFARKEVKAVEEYAHSKGFEGKLEAWDFAFWSERLKEDKYSFNAEELKPYFEIESCINAVFSLASRLYGLQFEPIDLPVYHKDVKVYDVKDAESGRHMALFYADFFPRESKRSGAWMTEFSGQYIKNGVEHRPIVSIVCNFTKPTAGESALITHDEFTTFLHEFGHSLHGMLAEGEFPSQTGTSVDHDFVELPSQINENWGYQTEYLAGFAKHYKTGEVIPAELIQKIIDSQNYLSAYYQVRQLSFGILDMAWHSLTQVPSESAAAFEKKAIERTRLLSAVEGTSMSQTFSHIFHGGYAAGYYSYKWAEVLAADAFQLFEQNGIFDPATAKSFRENILSKGDTEDPAVLFRRFRGRDPKVEALMIKLGLSK